MADWKDKLKRNKPPKKYGRKRGKEYGTTVFGEIKEKETNQTRARDMPKSIIFDYFRIYQRLHNRVPTLKEIEEEEGRSLTSDEIEDYYDEYKRVGGKV